MYSKNLPEYFNVRWLNLSRLNVKSWKAKRISLKAQAMKNFSRYANL
jgi:hypothetical protein